MPSTPTGLLSPAQTQVSPVSPWSLDYNQFIQATDPYFNGQQRSYGINQVGGTSEGNAGTYTDQWGLLPQGTATDSWYSGNGEIAGPQLQTSAGKSFNIGGAGSNIKKTGPDTYSINTDISQLTGQPDSNQHVEIQLKKQGDQLVPVGDPTSWTYTGTDLSTPVKAAVAMYLMANLMPALGAPAGATSIPAAAVEGAIASPVASGSAIGTDLGMLSAPAGASGAVAAAAPAATSAIPAAGSVASSAAPGLFNAAADSQLANAAIASGGGNALAGYTGSAINAAVPAASGGLLSSLGSGLSSIGSTIGGLNTASGGLLGAGANALGGYLNTQAATDAAKSNSDAIIRAAQIAADAAKFKPVGVTTNFGSSNFGYDANGNLTSAGYQLTPQMKAQQDALMGVSNNMLSQYQGAQAATAPMGDAAQRMMTLGNQYLASTPQEQAQKWMNDQQALLAGSRASDYAAMQNRLQNQGRTGLSVGGGGGMTAANPEMQAYYNAQRQQDLGLAANATQAGQQYATYGAGLVGSGGNMLNSMYGTQTAAYDPYKTALGGATNIEGLGQNAMDLGINLGAKGAAAGAASGGLLNQGNINAANMQNNVAQQVGSPWGNMLSGAANWFNNTQAL
jgi:hypothetical protein